MGGGAEDRITMQWHLGYLGETGNIEEAVRKDTRSVPAIPLTLSLKKKKKKKSRTKDSADIFCLPKLMGKKKSQRTQSKQTCLSQAAILSDESLRASVLWIISIINLKLMDLHTSGFPIFLFHNYPSFCISAFSHSFDLLFQSLITGHFWKCLSKGNVPLTFYRLFSKAGKGTLEKFSVRPCL